MNETTIPTDHFSRRRRELLDNPGADRSTSLLQLTDFYGNVTAWVVETFRSEGGETGFLSLSTAEGGQRFLLPPEVMLALSRQREQLVGRSRRRAARQGVATRRGRGEALGNPEALQRARSARRKGA